MRNIYRIMLGQRSSHAEACFTGNFVGTDYDLHQDLTNELTETWRPFNAKFVSVYLEGHPGGSRVAAGLACGAIWTVSKGIQPGDMIISPDGTGRYRIGEPEGAYWYAQGEILPHRRTVRWHDTYLDRATMSDALRKATGSTGAVANVSHHADEIEKLISGHPQSAPELIATSEGIIEDPLAFAMEKHLEAFLIANWYQTELGRDFDIYAEDGEILGQQFLTDTGAMDILGGVDKLVDGGLGG